MSACSFTVFSAAESALRVALKYNPFRPRIGGNEAYSVAIAALKAAHNLGVIYELVGVSASEDGGGYYCEYEQSLGLFSSEEHAKTAMNDLLLDKAKGYIRNQDSGHFEEETGRYDEISKGATLVYLKERDLF